MEKLGRVMKKEVSYKTLFLVLVLLALIAVPGFLAVRYYLAYQQAVQTTEELRSQLAFWEKREEYVREPRAGERSPDGEADALSILRTSPVITHAMGEYEGHTYLNCLEGFLDAYRRGCRVFEADFALTRDGCVVLRHDWSLALQDGIDPAHIPTAEEFLSTPILGQYTPLSFRDLLLLLSEYEDVCFVTDTKYAQPEVAVLMFRSMLEDAAELGMTAAVFDRIIIQVYSEDMLLALQDAYDFPYYIFTLYQRGFDETDEEFQTIAEFCKKHDVSGVTMKDCWWHDSFSEIAKEYDLLCFVHPVNDLKTAKDFMKSGVNAVYSACLTPDDFRS